MFANPIAFNHIEHVAYARALGADGWTGRAGRESGYDRARRSAADDAVFRPEPAWVDRTALDAKVDFIIAGLADRRPGL